MDFLNISRHCSERYAERIMGRDSKGDVATYVAQNQEKINTDINKLYQYGALIYSGILKEKQPVNVYLNGTWVLLVDKDKRNAITMYKIDFGLGDEFNKTFISKMLEKINSSGARYEEVQRETEEKKNEYAGIVSDFQAQINEYKGMIRNLEKQVNAYNDIIQAMGTETQQALADYRSDVMSLVCKKEF